MAEVFLAVKAEGGTPELAVIKRIWPELAGDPDFIGMFLDEAAVCARMDHPNVVRTFEVGREDDQYFIAMEYLRGHSLKQVLARFQGRGGLPLSLHLYVLAEVLAGLHHAHDLADDHGRLLGIVHRDVSPQNVFVTYDGAVKLVDFGIAKSVAASHRTRPGVLKGRLSYMAPEQMRAGDIDRRADVFSVGVLLWEAAAGRRLWEGLEEAAIVSRVVSGLALPPPLGPNRLPTGLLRVCRQALTLDRNERYATAAELRAELLRLIPDPPADCARQLGELLSSAFAQERGSMAEVARRGLESGASSSYDVAELERPAPSVTSTESLLRPFTTAPTPPPVRQRPGRAAARVVILGAMAGFAGFGAVHLLLPAPVDRAPPAAVRPAPRAAPPAFEPMAAPPVAAPAAAEVPAIEPPAPAATMERDRRLPARSASRRRRAAAASRELVAAPAPVAEPFDRMLPTAPRPRPRPLDLESPYLP
jgi:serine/threonine-protein kinase